MRIAISAGHGGDDPGAVNAGLGLEEHVEAVKICRDLEGQLASIAEVVVIAYGKFILKQKIAEVNRLHQSSPIDLAIEIHFNSNAGTPAHGTEVLYQSVKNEFLASSISRSLAAAIFTKDRGAKKRMNLGWLKQTKPPALIIEVLFINNHDEAMKTLDPNFSTRAAAGIVSGILGAAS